MIASPRQEDTIDLDTGRDALVPRASENDVSLGTESLAEQHARQSFRGDAETQEPQATPKKSEIVGWLDLPNKDQLFVLALCRLSEPLSNVCLLPYIFYLVRSVLPSHQNGQDGTHGSGSGADAAELSLAAEVSAYSGLLVAAFPLAQFFISLPWGWLSDSHGRKFSIVVGLAISTVANAAFGFSRSFGALMFWRTLAGLANGNVSIMRTMTAEVVKERKFQTKAFLLLPLVFNSGMVASLAFGGILAEPATSLPWLFGPSGIFNWSGHDMGVQWLVEFPYALPAMLNACMLGFAFLLAVFWLRETLPGKEDERDIGVSLGQAGARWINRVVLRRRGAAYVPLQVNDDDDRTDSSLEIAEVKEERASGTVTKSKPVGNPCAKPPFRSILTRSTIAALVSFGLLPLHNSAFMVCLRSPLF